MAALPREDFMAGLCHACFKELPGVMQKGTHINLPARQAVSATDRSTSRQRCWFLSCNDGGMSPSPPAPTPVECQCLHLSKVPDKSPSASLMHLAPHPLLSMSLTAHAPGGARGAAGDPTPRYCSGQCRAGRAAADARTAPVLPVPRPPHHHHRFFPACAAVILHHREVSIGGHLSCCLCARCAEAAGHCAGSKVRPRLAAHGAGARRCPQPGSGSRKWSRYIFDTIQRMWNALSADSSLSARCLCLATSSTMLPRPHLPTQGAPPLPMLQRHSQARRIPATAAAAATKRQRWAQPSGRRRCCGVALRMWRPC